MTCRWDCLGSTPATKSCPAGASCDCFGHCMGTTMRGALAVPIPHLTFSPLIARATRSTSSAPWSATDFVVDLSVNANTSVQPVVTLSSSAGMQIRCASAQDFSSACTLSGPWTYTLGADNALHAQATITAQPQAGVDPNGLPWTVTATSRDLDNPSSTTSVRGVTLNAIRDGAYTGFLTTSDPNFPTVEPITLPVTVEVHQGNVMVTDTTRSLYTTPITNQDSDYQRNFMYARDQNDFLGDIISSRWSPFLQDANGLLNAQLTTHLSTQVYNAPRSLLAPPVEVQWNLQVQYVGPNQASPCPCSGGLTCVASVNLCAVQDGNAVMGIAGSLSRGVSPRSMPGGCRPASIMPPPTPATRASKTTPPSSTAIPPISCAPRTSSTPMSNS